MALFATTIAGSLPKPAWLAEPNKLWPAWRGAGAALEDAKRDATLLALKLQEDCGIDIVTDGEQSRQHFVHGFLEFVEGIDFARKVGASMIVRGLRAVTDFDLELQMFGMNYRMAPDIETIYLMASERHQFIASRLVKEVAMLGGDIASFVPSLTLDRVMKRIRENRS